MTENIDYDNIHWIGGTNRKGDSYDAGDLCYDCCNKKVNNINKKLVEHSEYKALVDGGWDARETEQSAVCDGCGDNLTYSLIDKDSELEHFNTYLKKEDIKNKNICYQLLNLIESPDFKESSEPERKLLISIKKHL